jgi:type IV secretory pathway VirD2 relaxase
MGKPSNALKLTTFKGFLKDMDPFDEDGLSRARQLVRNTTPKSRPQKPKPMGGGPAPRKYANARGRSSIRNAVPGQQRCSVRVSYVANGSAGHWRQHGIYLERDGAQREGGKGQGFALNLDSVPVGRTLDAWQHEADERLFKLILSPEFGSKVDLREFTREFMQSLEQDLDTKLQWVAIDHHNTDYPHVHVCLRGIDEDGNPLAIHPAYIKEGMRMRAQEWLTAELGYRSEQDQQESREREIVQQRLTGLDRELVKLARKHPEQEIVFSPSPNPKVWLREKHLRARLQVLEEMGLATRTGLLHDELSWRLAESFEEALKKLSRAKDKQKALAQHQEFVLDKHAKLKSYRMKEGQFLAGRVLGTGIDESSDKLYVLVEGEDGAIHYILHDYKAGAEVPLKPGDIALLEGMLGDDGQLGLSVIVVEDIPEDVLDKLIRARLRKADDLEEPGELDTFSNRVKRKLQDRRQSLMTLGIFTQMRQQARSTRAKRKVKARQVAADGKAHDIEHEVDAGHEDHHTL